MAARNAEPFIEETIYGILNQTHQNLELIIVNDCSTDQTEQRILSIKDERIKYLSNSTHLGPGRSRNIGLQHAKGDFITITDSDDISVPERLALQLNFLQKNPEIDLVSGGMQYFGSADKNIVTFPQSPEFIHCWLLFNNCLPNIVFYRRELVDNKSFKYNDFWFGEDYYLWYELIKKGYRFSTLPDVLIQCRVHENRITTTNLEKRTQDIYSRFAQRIYDTFGIEIPPENFGTITTFIHTRLAVDNEKFAVIKHFLEQLYMENKRQKIYDQTFFSAVLYFYFLRLGKYFFIEQGKPLQFAKYFSALVYMLGLKSLIIFLRNNKGYR